MYKIYDTRNNGFVIVDMLSDIRGHINATNDDIRRIARSRVCRVGHYDVINYRIGK